jgi:hypothetical protein
VCRGWRSVLLERSLWTTRLDLSRASGVRLSALDVSAMYELLHCASGRAGGCLQALRIDTRVVCRQTLLDLVTANAGALRELQAYVDDGDMDLGLVVSTVETDALVAAAPLLCVFAVDLGYGSYEVQTVRRMLRNEGPFGALRVRHLSADLQDEDGAGVVAFAADVSAHESLCAWHVDYAPLHTPAALDAVVGAALARRMNTLVLDACHLIPASVPALVRLLSGGALTTLGCSFNTDLLDAPAAALLAAALRSNSTLTSLSLASMALFDDDTVTAEMLGALTGHASVHILCLRHNETEAARQAAAGAMLSALIAANAPALMELDVSECILGDDGLRALFNALPMNTHLRVLRVAGNQMSEPFARDVLLPAVRANTSLHKLDGEQPLMAETNALVSARSAAAAAAAE